MFSCEATGWIPDGGPPLTVQFYDDSTGEIERRDWDFGDGTTSADDHSPRHVYSKIGKHKVMLSVSGPGGSDTETKIVSTIFSPSQPVTWGILLSDEAKVQALQTALDDWSLGSSLDVRTVPGELLDILLALAAAGELPELLLLSRSELLPVLQSDLIQSVAPLDELLETANYPETQLEPARVEGRVYGVPYGDSYLLHLGDPSRQVVSFIAHLTQALSQSSSSGSALLCVSP